KRYAEKIVLVVVRPHIKNIKTTYIMEKDKKNKILDLNIENEDKKMGETTGEDLKYNAQEDSFELDPETEDEEYQHHLPYDTSAPSGEDDDSSYDEENFYTR